MLAMEPVGAASATPPPAVKPPSPEALVPAPSCAPPDSVAFGEPRTPSVADALLCANTAASPRQAEPTAEPLGLSSNILKGISAAHSSAWFPQGPLPPNAEQIDPNGYRYNSDMFGRPVTASGDLHLDPNAAPDRSAAAKRSQLRAGGPDRLSTDHGGHGIGHQFGGRTDEWNLVPQDRNYNKSTYAVMENSWKSTLQEGGSVHADVRHVYDRPTLRPTHQIAETSLDGDAPALRVMKNVPHEGPVASAEGIGRSEAFLTRMGHVSEGLDTFGKVAAPVAVAADGYNLYRSFRQDGDTIGKHTLETGGSVAGGWAGAVAGSEMGAEGGAVVGGFFGGVGAVPGAIVGGLVGGAVGGIAGSQAGTDMVKFGESAAGAVKSAAKSAVHAGKDVAHDIGNAGSKALHFFGL
jgi:hypothetical protein